MKSRPDPYTFGNSGFRLGEFTEHEMRLLASGELPEWLPRLARRLLSEAHKQGITFEDQDPDVRAEAV